MEYSSSETKEGGKALISFLVIIALLFIIAKLVSRFRAGSSFLPKGKCLLPNAMLGCKRIYGDRSFDCVDCERLKDSISSNYVITELQACIQRCKHDCPACNCNKECEGMIGDKIFLLKNLNR